MKGSEAVLRKSIWNGKPCVIKDRIPKRYRIEQLDIYLRKKRTRSEAKILKKLNDGKINSPQIYFYDEFSITMEFLEGIRPRENEKNIKEAGKIL
jgi:Kae1-associated kinase Bud32